MTAPNRLYVRPNKQIDTLGAFKALPSECGGFCSICMDRPFLGVTDAYIWKVGMPTPHDAAESSLCDSSTRSHARGAAEPPAWRSGPGIGIQDERP